MKILFVGGSGIISSACVERACAEGHHVTLLTRGTSDKLRPPPPTARMLVGDIRNQAQTELALGRETFDVVANFVAFEVDHVESDLRLFRGRTGQYVFISSASAYKKPTVSLPITESTPLVNPYWQYSRNKIACEERLLRAYRDEGFPVTIIRPSHTYDRTLLPFDPHGAGGTVLSRIQRGRPVVVHGDGTSLWVLTHHRDFAVGFSGLLGNPAALGEAFHITSDEALPWNEIFRAIASAVGRNVELVHVPSAVIARHHPAWGDGLLGDKAHSVLFDNSKVRRLVPEFRPSIPFFRGAREIVEYHLAHPERLTVDPGVESLMDDLVLRAGSW